MTRQWFISDLHLAIDRPETLALFERFLTSFPRPGDRVFILGDLFDAWIGDDDDGTLAQRARAILRDVSTALRRIADVDPAAAPAPQQPEPSVES